MHTTNWATANETLSGSLLRISFHFLLRVCSDDLMKTREGVRRSTWEGGSASTSTPDEGRVEVEMVEAVVAGVEAEDGRAFTVDAPRAGRVAWLEEDEDEDEDEGLMKRVYSTNASSPIVREACSDKADDVAADAMRRRYPPTQCESKR